MRQSYIASDAISNKALSLANFQLLEERKSRLLANLNKNGIAEPDYKIEYREEREQDRLLICYLAIPSELVPTDG